MPYYHYHPGTSEYIGSTEEKLDVEATKVNGYNTYHLPPQFATTTVAPTYSTHEIPIWDTNTETWSLVSDYRGTDVYDVWGNVVVIEEIGPLPDNTFLDPQDITDDDKRNVIIPQIISYGDQLIKANIYYDGIEVDISSASLSEISSNINYLTNNPYSLDKLGTVTSIDYTYGSTESTIVITGTPSSIIAINDIIVIDGYELVITRINGSHYTTTDPRPTSNGTYTVNHIYTPNSITDIVDNGDGTYSTYNVGIDDLKDIHNSIMSYKQQVKNSISNKIVEVSLLSGTSLDNYDVTTNWPTNIYTS